MKSNEIIRTPVVASNRSFQREDTRSYFMDIERMRHVPNLPSAEPPPPLRYIDEDLAPGR